VHFGRRSDAGNWSGRGWLRATALRTARLVARHQSSGRCSAHSDLREAKGTCSSVADATMRPSSPMTKARVPPVPTSMPRRYCAMVRRTETGEGEFAMVACREWLVNVFIPLRGLEENHSGGSRKRMIPFLWPLVPLNLAADGTKLSKNRTDTSKSCKLLGSLRSAAYE